jgi:phosphopantothenate-cysteine ligase
MDQVPKILKPLVSEWTSEGFFVSFKVCATCSCIYAPLTPPQLETDKNLLGPKAHAALERYGHQVVIANRLDNRKFEVTFVTRADGAPETGKPAFKEEVVRLRDGCAEIEEDIVAKLVTAHDQWIAGGCTALAPDHGE